MSALPATPTKLMQNPVPENPQTVQETPQTDPAFTTPDGQRTKKASINAPQRKRYIGAKRELFQ
jgi:hypothetical protein